MREPTPAEVLAEKYPEFFTGIHFANVDHNVVDLPSFQRHLDNIMAMVRLHCEPEHTFKFVQIKTKFDWICLYFDYCCSHGHGARQYPPEIQKAVKDAEAELGVEWKELMRARKEIP